LQRKAPQVLEELFLYEKVFGEKFMLSIDELEMYF
jgi:hypothetical protein